MTKKWSWLSKLKNFFISESHSKPEKHNESEHPIILLSPFQAMARDESEDQKRKHDSIVRRIEGETREFSAIKIQTAFRAYLARKALRALKGLVKLQAIIRGQAVRRQAISTLKCLQSIVSIQSQVRAMRSQSLQENYCAFNDVKLQWQELEDKIETTNQRGWDKSILTKEEANALYISKKEASMKRERIREYALSHRNSADQIPSKPNRNLRFWLEQWVDAQLAKRKDLEEISSISSSDPTTKQYSRKHVKYTTNYKTQYRLEGLVSPISESRRSYMAATESAKAKTRSISCSPKIRSMSFDTYSECTSSPYYKNKLNVMSNNVRSEKVDSSNGKIGKSYCSHYRSPSLKEIPENVISRRRLKDHSFDLECSSMNWDRYNSFR